MRVHRMVQKMLLLGIVLVAVHAYAAPVHLACTNEGVAGAAGKIIIKFSLTMDESAHQVSMGISDPDTAVFTETSVKWIPEGGEYKSEYVLDRVTGQLTNSVRNIQGKVISIGQYNCEVVEKRF